MRYKLTPRERNAMARRLAPAVRQARVRWITRVHVAKIWHDAQSRVGGNWRVAQIIEPFRVDARASEQTTRTEYLLAIRHAEEN